MVAIVRLDKFIDQDYTIRTMTSVSPSSSNTLRRSRMVRFGLVAFAFGLFVGQLVNEKSAMMDYVKTLNMGSRSNRKKMTLFKIDTVKEKYGPIKNIALLGERNSGTTWITQELTDCFKASGITITKGLIKDKHFFQHDDFTVPRVSTLVVSMFRNPYDWSLAMQKRPHHSPEHLGLEIEEFLIKPWGMERPQRDLPYADMTGPICQQGYYYKEVVPCLKLKQKPLDYDEELKNRTGISTGYSSWDPQYELRQDGSQRFYDSILHLRQAKIKNILSIKNWDWIATLRSVHYEKLLEEGTEPFFKELEEILGVKMQCTPSPPSPERLSKYKMDPKVVKLINDQLDWGIEGEIGYSKQSSKKKLLRG